MDKVKVNNITLAYVQRGRGTSLVLLHGYPLDHHIWDEIAPFLEDTFNLIMPDLRGFGETTTVDVPYSMDDYASDIAALLDHLGIEKAAIAGHSMGGYVALAFARLYPNRVSGLGLVSSQVLADTPDRRQGRYATAAQVAKDGVDFVAETMASKLSPDLRVQAFVAELIRRQSPSAVIGALKAMAERADSTPLISTFHFPVVLAHGDSDALIPIDRAREAKAALPAATLVELKDVGHMPMMEDARSTAEILKLLS